MAFRNKIFIVAAAASLVAPAAVRAETNVSMLQISRPGDMELACGDLSQEATTMRDIIFTTQDIQNSSKLKSRGVGVAGAAASFLVGTVTGGIGLAAAGFLIDENLSNNADEADGVQSIAEQRRSFIMGVYNAKGCFGPMDHALQDPEKLETLSQIAEAVITPNDAPPSTRALADIEPAAGDRYARPRKKRYNE